MAQTNRYALADYTVEINFDGTGLEGFNGQTSLKIGGPGSNGEGSFIGEIKVSRSSSLWSTEGSVTGSWVHSINLDRTGSVEISINQISDQVIKLTQLCNKFESLDATKGCTISIFPNQGNNSAATAIASCVDCYPTKVPEKVYGEKPREQTWSFTCGQVVFNETTTW